MDQAASARQGIILIITGLVIASFTGAIMKLLSSDLSAVQITWFRFLGFAALMAPLVVFKLGVGAFKPNRPSLQLVRGLTMAVATTAFIAGAATVDYADAIAILYAYPFLLTVLAALFLKEAVSWQGWIGVIGGFIGVLMIMRPDFNGLDRGAALVFLCAVIVSFQMLLNRKLGAISHPLVTSFWGGLIATIILTPFLAVQWQSIPPQLYWLILVLIASGAANQFLLVAAFAKTEASTLAPFTYFEIVSAVVFGLLFFDTLPTWLSWVGILLIFASGVLVARTVGLRPTPKRQPKF